MNPRQALISFALALVVPTTVASTLSARSAAQKACKVLGDTFPGLIAFPGSTQFANDIAHYAFSSEQNSTCSIEPETPADVSKILGIVGRPDIRSPFAVKGGGHSYNVAFSSTLGVQISMAKFKAISYDARANTVTVGTGVTWGEVYEALEPMGVTVVGGRIPAVGVAGLSLGGGYSWKTSQYGLTIDTIVAHDIVLPSGEFVRASKNNHPDLFFGLKGGLNNFGIVTAITFETHPQSLVFAGSVFYAENVTDQVNQAVSEFDLTNKDTKAQLMSVYAFTNGSFLTAVYLYYDAPTIPAGIFDKFLSIPSIVKDVRTQTLVNYLNAAFGNPNVINEPTNAAHQGVPIVHYTIPILNEMKNLTIATGQALAAQFGPTNIVVTCTAEPFVSPFSHSRGGAYPHPPSRQVTPAAPVITTTTAADDSRGVLVARVLKEFAKKLQARAVQEGQSRWDDLGYPNYMLADTPLKLMYGENVPTLKALARKYDPRGVMQLTGGFIFR